MNIVRPHRTPWFISGWRRGITSWGGRQGTALANNCPGLGEVSPLSPGVETSPELFRGFGAGRTALRKAAGHAPDRNKCTPHDAVTQSLRCYSPADLRLLLEGTGLFVLDVEPFTDETYGEPCELVDAMRYLATLTPA